MAHQRARRLCAAPQRSSVPHLPRQPPEVLTPGLLSGLGPARKGSLHPAVPPMARVRKPARPYTSPHANGAARYGACTSKGKGFITLESHVQQVCAATLMDVSSDPDTMILGDASMKATAFTSSSWPRMRKVDCAAAAFLV